MHCRIQIIDCPCSHASNPLLQITINLKPSDCIDQQFPQVSSDTVRSLIKYVSLMTSLTPQCSGHTASATTVLTDCSHTAGLKSSGSCTILATQPPPLVLHAPCLAAPMSLVKRYTKKFVLHFIFHIMQYRTMKTLHHMKILI